jgi:hypothetical protein
MHAGTEMVNDMIAIVPANFIIDSIDAIDRVGIEVIRIAGVYESVLCPVAQHHYEPGKDQGDYKYYQCRLQVDKAHDDTEDEISIFSHRKPLIHFPPFPVIEIKDSIPDADS